MCVLMKSVKMHLHLLFLGGVLCAALPPPAFSTRIQMEESSWKQQPSVRDEEDLKLIYDLTRSTRHADGLFTSGYSRLLSQLTAKDYLESLIAKRVNGDLLEDQSAVKRHSDAIFTDSYSRFRKQMAAKKHLNAMLQGKRSAEDPEMLEVLMNPDSTSSQSVEDSVVQDMITQLNLAQ
ncbi:VIP peptides-like [Leuresthes tenuis]|uniref:VIP peptides-like n=1 Tax=Leuresthes tenuis TaxID=355514 RepID=UPI003B5148E0